MIVVRIELWPGGNQVDVRELGALVIANAETGTNTSGDYAVVLSERREPAKSVPIRLRKPWRWGAVRHFPRKRLNAYDLLLRALLATVGDRNRGAIRAALDELNRKRTQS